jgi:hypothetical protein
VFLRSVQVNLDSIVELSVLDASGRLVASSVASPAPAVLPAAWSDRKAIGSPVQLMPQWDSPRERNADRDRAGSGRARFSGALVGIIDLAPGAAWPRSPHPRRSRSC